MRIAVIGSGNVGGTLGRRWAALGHSVVFGVRDPARGADAVKGGGALPANASVDTIAGAVSGADVVLLATPWQVAAAALGFDAIDAGVLRRARELEWLASLWIGLASGGMGRDFAFRVVRR
jgi:predicted dinucleotide-binding enzyme